MQGSMITEKEKTRLSKFLSLVLRHKPQEIGLELDSNGWADVGLLLQKCSQRNVPITLDILKDIVETNPKKRFAFNEQLTKIRASQGHSVAIDLQLQAVEPPVILYHGTAEKSLAAILENGLVKQQRQHVHLSATIETAKTVGSRHGKPCVLEVMAQQMFANGYQFYLSANGVWLTDHVPAIYLRELAIEKK
jgi:putative RNA 2'-phosphotransferase